MTAAWDITPCSLVEVYRRFRSACCIHHQDICVLIGLMKAVTKAETSVNFYETTRLNIPDGCHFYTRRHENLKSLPYFQWYSSLHRFWPLTLVTEPSMRTAK
jgi:hypothetical protein